MQLTQCDGLSRPQEALETQPRSSSSCRELVKDQGYSYISSSTSRALATIQCRLATKMSVLPNMMNQNTTKTEDMR